MNHYSPEHTATILTKNPILTAARRI